MWKEEKKERNFMIFKTKQNKKVTLYWIFRFNCSVLNLQSHFLGTHTIKKADKQKKKKAALIHFNENPFLISFFIFAWQKEKRFSLFTSRKAVSRHIFHFFSPFRFIHSFIQCGIRFSGSLFLCFVFVFSFNHNDWFQIKLNWKKNWFIHLWNYYYYFVLLWLLWEPLDKIKKT